MLKAILFLILSCVSLLAQGPGFIANLNVVFPAAPGGTPPIAGPIDVVSANVWGAWSVCLRLSTNYTGDAIRIREDSGNTETDIGYVDRGDGYWELNTNAINSHCGSANGLIVTIYANIGTYHYTQATASQQPKIYDGATEDVLRDANGLPYADFDGTDDNMSTPDGDLAQPRTDYIVILQDAWVDNDRLIDGLFVNSATIFQHTSTPTIGVFAISTTFNFGTQPGLDRWFLATIVWNNTSSIAQIDDETEGTGNLTYVAGAIEGIRLFRRGDAVSGCADGYFQSMVTYSAAHAIGDRGTIQTNLNASHVIY